MEYAGFWPRLAAYLIDTVVIVLGFILLLLLFSPFLFFDDSSIFAILMPLFLWGISILASGAYIVLMTSSKHQATLGKKMMGLIVTDENGNRLDFSKSALRFIISYILSSFTSGLIYLVVAFTDKKKGIHDMVANTVVVRKESLHAAVKTPETAAGNRWPNASL
ncbi:MAG: RDD family protein [Bacillus sp. (in: firmicutes)]